MPIGCRISAASVAVWAAAGSSVAAVCIASVLVLLAADVCSISRNIDSAVTTPVLFEAMFGADAVTKDAALASAADVSFLP